MLKKFVMIVALCAVFGGRAEAASILVFGQASLASVGVTATTSAAGTTLTVSDLGVTITSMENGAPNTAAVLNLTANSTSQAVAGAFGSVLQEYAGTFSITGGGNNYLSGFFMGSLVSGLNGGTGLSFQAAQPPAGLGFTSTVITSLDTPRAMALSFTNVNQAVAVIDVDPTGAVYNTLRGFTSNVAGDFSAEPGVPEPMSLALLGLGLFGIAVRHRRRR